MPINNRTDRRIVRIDNTRFIFNTNFEGNPENDPVYHSASRKGNVIINDIDLAQAMIDEGFNVRQTKPRPGFEDEFEPEYFIAVHLNFNPPPSVKPPIVRLATRPDVEPSILDEETIRRIDILQNQRMIDKVCVICNVRNLPTGGKTLYVSSMLVIEREDLDPYANWFQKPTDDMDTDDDLPF